MENPRNTEDQQIAGMPPQLNISPQLQHTGTPPAKRTIKIRVILVVSAVGLILIMVLVLLLLQKNRLGTGKTNLASPESGATNSPQPGQNAVARYKDAGMPGLAFDVPAGWSVTKEVFGEREHDISYALYSEDAIAYSEGFEALRQGVSVKIHMHERDKSLEAGKARPLDAHISAIGAPRLEEPGVDIAQQKIDISKFKYYTNKSGTELVSYPWSYEGCFVNTHLLGEKNVYSISVHTADGCPGLDTLTTNQAVAGIIDSLRLSSSDNPVKSDALVIITTAKNANTCEVQSKDAAYRYTSIPDAKTFKHVVSCFSVVAKTGSGGGLGTVYINDSAETMASSFDCEGCGFLEYSYDATITHAKDTANTEGMEQIADKTFGTAKDVAAIQKDGIAKRYTYLKLFEGESLKVDFVYEVIKDKAELPDFKAAYILDIMESLVMLD